jgi:hypothetical protein
MGLLEVVWPKRTAPGAGETSDLHSESFDAYVARNEGGERYAALQMVFSGTLAGVLLVVAVATENQAAGLALAIPLIFFGSAYEQWREARSGREGLRHDVVALSNVLYQDASMINKVLADEMIHEYLENLLQAALDDEEFGRAYWKQALRPFLEEGEKGFREDWRYRIDLSLLEDSVRVPLPGSNGFAIEPQDFWRLATVASYRQQVKRPRHEYYIGATFSLQNLPEWFRDEGFLLRELAHISPQQKEALACVFSDEWIDLAGPEGEEARAAADTLFDCDLRLAGQELEPKAVQISELGVRRRYEVGEELRELMADPIAVRIGIKTFQPRTQTFFPVNITLPTRHPSVQFTYCRTPLAPALVGANVFFSAEQPYQPELVERDDDAGRIDIQTERDDWVFAGSGCMFAWREPGQPSPS